MHLLDYLCLVNPLGHPWEKSSSPIKYVGSSGNVGANSRSIGKVRVSWATSLVASYLRFQRASRRSRISCLFLIDLPFKHFSVYGHYKCYTSRGKDILNVESQAIPARVTALEGKAF